MLVEVIDLAASIPEMRKNNVVAVLLTIIYPAFARDLPLTPELYQGDPYYDLPTLNLTIRPGEPICLPGRYGNDLKPVSCKNAWDKIDRSSFLKRFATRRRPEGQAFDSLTPLRYLSDDGVCAIDVIISPDHRGDVRGWDVTSGLTLSDKAWELLRQCVTYGQGGSVSRFSKLPRELTEFHNLPSYTLLSQRRYYEVYCGG